MNYLFLVLFLCYAVFVPHKSDVGKIVNLSDQKGTIEQAIKDYNCTNPEIEVVLAKSVGNHGRYKNIGFDYECLHRRGQVPNEREQAKGLRRFDKGDYSFLYWDSEATQAFVDYLNHK